MTTKSETNLTVQDRLLIRINELIAPMGYEIVYLEVQNHRQKILRLFIDRLGSVENSQDGKGGIGIEDCVKVTKALDEPLDQVAEIDEAFSGPYELEVSSPGVDRPLRQAKDFARFSGREVRIHVFRPLTQDEIGNGEYQARNPKQKNFLGTLKGLDRDRVLLTLSPGDGTEKSSKKKTKKPDLKNRVDEIKIPLPLISKANLEPRFDFDSEEDERE